MASQYLVSQKLIATSAHLARQTTAEYFKAFILGTRNGMQVIDGDKTAVCLRNAVSFLGSLISGNGRAFFLRTKNDIKDEVLDHMAAKLGCTHDTQMGIPGYSTNTPGLRRNLPKKIRINLGGGAHQKPDCFVILGSESSDRKLAVIQEADRSQIPTVCLVDPGMPLQYYRRITYPIPAVDTPQFVHLFCNLVTKMVLLERQKLKASPEEKSLALSF